MRNLKPLILIAALGAPAALAEPVAGAAQALNHERADAGRGGVVLSDRLQAAAEAHAQDMRRRGFFSHQGSNGGSVGARAKKQGYRYCLIAENIAKGQRTLAEVMQSWMRSAGHRKNMLHRDVLDFGLARVDQNIWVMVLGRPGC